MRLVVKSKNRAVGLLSVFLFVAYSAWGQLPSQDPGHKEYSEVAGVKFSVPKRFVVQKPSTQNVAFMLRAEYGLGLFVAVPDGPVNDRYLTDLSNVLASKLLPKEPGFQWKLFSETSSTKVSDFQIGRGNTKGLNGKKLVQTTYILVEVKGRRVLVGYITTHGHDTDAKWLFDLDGSAGMSMPGWYAQAHIIASVTGEKYERINPGTELIAVPPEN
jgi:hypothetical protein